MVTKDLGGKTNYRLALPWIDEYQVIKGLDVVNKFKSELEYLNFARHMEPVEKISKKGSEFVVTMKGGDTFSSKAVIVASGTRQQFLDVPGEKEFMMRGLCYSALSFAPLFIEKQSVVVGDGELALRSAAELATVAKHVTIVGPTDKIMKTELGKKLDAAENVSVLKDHTVVKVLGDEFAEKIVVKSPEGEESEITADGTFIEMALIPNSKMVSSLVDLDDQGRIVVDCYNRTSMDGIFAAGDVTNTYAEQVLVAVGEGAKAALTAYEYLLPLL
jgi:thioredoxin reductase